MTQGNLDQTAAAGKGIATDGGDTGQGDRGHGPAIFKGILPDIFHADRDLKRLQRKAPLEGADADLCQAGRDLQCFQIICIRKSIIAYNGHALWNGDAGYSVGISKGIIAYDGHAVRNDKFFYI